MSSGISALGTLGLRRLLVAVDGSPSSDLALIASIIVAQRDNASLTLVTVEPDLALSTASLGYITLPPQQMQEDARREAERILAASAARIPDDIPATTILRFGKIGPQIVAEANSGKYDAILIGARGVGRVGSLQGSVSQHVLHNAEIPVFITHAPPGFEIERPSTGHPE